ncbi:hypothetical protein [Viridibacillus arvi]|uniref:hypothetical protein n=1 Tax=Viridibacillus arvi TaxID=263475 RepID=UPI0034CEC9CD
MKGVITLNIEVDYGKMLDQANHNAIYLFTGAKTVEEMIKVHMDKVGEDLEKALKGKPLLTYTVEGRLRKDPMPAPEPVPPVTEVPTPVLTEDKENVVTSTPKEDIAYDLVVKLDEAIEHVSLELGIPQVIKANEELMGQLATLGNHEEKDISEYKGFAVEPEGMEEPFIIVYKTYGGSDIKFYESAMQNNY